MKAGVWGGLLGVATGMAVVAWVNDNAHVPQTIVLVFWPSSIFGFGYKGGGGWTGLLVSTLVFGGQAMVYGCAGAAIGALVNSYTDGEHE